MPWIVMLGIENLIEVLWNCFGLDQFCIGIYEGKCLRMIYWPCINVCEDQSWMCNVNACICIIDVYLYKVYNCLCNVCGCSCKGEACFVQCDWTWKGCDNFSYFQIGSSRNYNVISTCSVNLYSNEYCPKMQLQEKGLKSNMLNPKPQHQPQSASKKKKTNYDVGLGLSWKFRLPKTHALDTNFHVQQFGGKNLKDICTLKPRRWSCPMHMCVMTTNGGRDRHGKRDNNERIPGCIVWG